MELVLLLPLVALVLAVVWQLVLAGHAAWAASGAARSAARAHAVGLDPAAAARRALPSRLEPGLRVEPDEDGSVEVRVRIPALTRRVDLGATSARFHFEPQSP